MLAKLGFTDSIDNLEPWQIEAYKLIDNTIAEYKEKELSKNKRGMYGK